MKNYFLKVTKEAFNLIGKFIDKKFFNQFKVQTLSYQQTLN